MVVNAGGAGGGGDASGVVVSTIVVGGAASGAVRSVCASSQRIRAGFGRRRALLAEQPGLSGGGASCLCHSCSTIDRCGKASLSRMR